MSAPAAATKEQIKAIHTLKSRTGLDDAAYRTMLSGLGVASSKELSKGAAARLIDRLNGDAEPSRANGALALSGPYAGVCRALWLSAWNLGLVTDRRDTALTAFVKRQTGMDSLNWVRDPAEGAKVIEALKRWIVREAGVVWPTQAGARKAGLRWSRARKIAVIAAQQRILGNDWAEPDWAEHTDADLDEAMQGFGRAIRAGKVR